MTFDLPLHPEECVKAPTCEISSVLRVHIAHACESGVPDAHLMQIPSAADIGDTAAGQVSKSKSLLCIQEADQAPPPCCEIDLDTIASRCESISKPKAIGVAELQCVEAASLQLTGTKKLMDSKGTHPSLFLTYEVSSCKHFHVHLLVYLPDNYHMDQSSCETSITFSQHRLINEVVDGVLLLYHMISGIEQSLCV